MIIEQKFDTNKKLKNTKIRNFYIAKFPKMLSLCIKISKIMGKTQNVDKILTNLPKTQQNFQKTHKKNWKKMFALHEFRTRNTSSDQKLKN